MSDRRGNRLSSIGIGVAILVGLAFGSREQILTWFGADSPEIAASGMNAVPEVTSGSDTAMSAPVSAPGTAAPVSSRSPRESHSDATVPEEDSVIRTGNGVVLASAREGGLFRGYRVVDPGRDDRLVEGAVIVAINGDAVEDSAAGGELLAAALQSPDADLTLESAPR